MYQNLAKLFLVAVDLPSSLFYFPSREQTWKMKPLLSCLRWKFSVLRQRRLGVTRILVIIHCLEAVLAKSVWGRKEESVDVRGRHQASLPGWRDIQDILEA